ncbi:hypothetical protein [Nocardia salmonicida]|uniref:hypothetical protein n=1 Tax=Nocardia salmonicida TaxID=53431 RepID=UPI0007A47103|nr:hypothetical protein [Nocardia salmonicida]
MRRWIALFELGFAVLFLACAVVSWQAARRTTEFVGTDEHPGFVAVRYVPPLLLLACALVTVGGLLVIDGLARIYARSVARRDVEPMI